MTAYSFACTEFPGMEGCPGKVQAETEAELWQLVEAHARIAHGEEISDWTDEDRAQVKALIKTVTK